MCQRCFLTMCSSLFIFEVESPLSLLINKKDNYQQDKDKPLKEGLVAAQSKDGRHHKIEGLVSVVLRKQPRRNLHNMSNAIYWHTGHRPQSKQLQ